MSKLNMDGFKVSPTQIVKVIYIDNVDLCFHAPDEIREEPEVYRMQAQQAIKRYGEPTHIQESDNEDILLFMYF